MDQSTKMSVNVGLVVTQIVDIDFDQKSLTLNVEFLMDWTDQLIKINSSVTNFQNTVCITSSYFHIDINKR